MSNSVFIELTRVKSLANEAKIEEALQIINDLEQKNSLTPEEFLRTQKIKGWLITGIGQHELALKIADKLYQKSQEMKMPLFSLDALSIKSLIYFVFRDFYDKEKFFAVAEQHENLFNSIQREDSPEYQEREAHLFAMKANRSYYKGKLDLSLDYCKKSISLLEKLVPHPLILSSTFISSILPMMANLYQEKGELNLALEFNERTLSMIPKGAHFANAHKKKIVFSAMGGVYYQKGDLDSALEYYKLSLEISIKFLYDAEPFARIIQIWLAKKDLKQAQNYLQQLKEFNEKGESKIGKMIYQFSRALILKSSSRMRDRVEAENILKKIIEASPETMQFVHPLFNLCELYFEEFRIFNQVEILDDIQPLIDRLLRISRLSNSYSLLAHVKLLQAKLALLQVSMVEARKLLTEAQKIADEHDLQLLAGEISREHDRLLEELKLWESIKKTQASLTERLKLASVEVVLERMQGKRAIELPEFDIEEPILLLIMDSSGVTYFNYSFVENWDFSDLFSSFMSAFNAFSGEIFSKSIDRIKIGENTILINPIEPYLACYVIKGQSYPAQQKLNQFSDVIRTTPEIWDALNRAAKTSEMLELNNPSSLGNTVNEIFIT